MTGLLMFGTSYLISLGASQAVTAARRLYTGKTDKGVVTENHVRVFIVLTAVEAIMAGIVWKFSDFPYATWLVVCIWASQLYYVTSMFVLQGKELVITRRRSVGTIIWAIWHSAFVLIMALA